MEWHIKDGGPVRAFYINCDDASAGDTHHSGLVGNVGREACLLRREGEEDEARDVDVKVLIPPGKTHSRTVSTMEIYDAAVAVARTSKITPSENVAGSSQNRYLLDISTLSPRRT